MDTKHTPATPQYPSLDELTAFHTNPTAANAVALAIADHRAGTLTDWPFVDALRKAQERCDAYPQLVAALRGLESNARIFSAAVQNGENEGAILSKRQTTQIMAERARALLRELGEAE